MYTVLTTQSNQSVQPHYYINYPSFSHKNVFSDFLLFTQTLFGTDTMQCIMQM